MMTAEKTDFLLTWRGWGGDGITGTLEEIKESRELDRISETTGSNRNRTIFFS